MEYNELYQHLKKRQLEKQQKLVKQPEITNMEEKDNGEENIKKLKENDNDSTSLNCAKLESRMDIT